MSLTATVTPSVASGRVTFYDGVTVLGTKSLISGTASISTIMLPAGSRKLKAYYAGDGSNAAAASNVVIQTVNAQPSGGLAARSPITTPVDKVYAVADFNGDGKADLAYNDGSLLTIRVVLGNGDGSFQPPSVNTNIGPGFLANAFSVSVGDFNGDGKVDLVVCRAGPDSLKVLLGNGDGTFQILPEISIPGLSSAMVGDFNSDGKADLLVLQTGGIGILLGNGDGTFQTPIATASPANSVVIGDFNGDGKTDFATINSGVDNNLRILLGKGDGTFQQPIIYVLPGSPTSLVVGDFNGDLKEDLAVNVISVPGNNAIILLGQGDGRFQGPVTYAAGTIGSSVSVGDLNGDGKADLLLNGNSFTPVLTALPGKGDGTFQSPIYFTNTFNNSALFIGELNGDGRTDLVLTDGHILLGSSVSVTPSGTPQSALIATSFPSQLQVTVKDGANPISGAAVTFAAPSTGPTAVLSSNTAITDASGMASVMATANSLNGRYIVTATVLGVSTPFFLTNLAGPLSITASPTLPQSTLLGTAFPKPLQVTIKDSSFFPASGVTVTYTAPANGASAALSGTVVTDAFGTASVTATANNVRGSYTVTASFGGLSANFLMTNQQSTAVTLATSANPSTFGAPVTLTATVTNSTATGKVTFFDGVNILGTKPTSSGTASISTILLPAGIRKLTAYYRDDANFVVGTSNVVSQTVRAVASQALLSQSPPSLPAVFAPVVGDFNGDGKADFAMPGSIRFQWWQVDLGASSTIGSIAIWNRTDSCCVSRLNDYWVFVSDTPFDSADTPTALSGRAGTFSSHQSVAPNPSTNIAVGAQGRYVRVQLTAANSYLNLAEVQVFGTGAQASTNLAPGKSATQSSTLPGYATAGAASAVDGITDGNFFDGSVTHTDSAADTISVVLGKGDGTFQAPASFGSGSGLFSVAVGDFNGDGNADLVALSSSIVLSQSVATVSILLGNGDGTFRAAINSPAGSHAAPFGVGDFNGDGKADIVIGFSDPSPICHLCSPFITGMTLLLGNSDGTFGTPVSYSGFGPPIVMADFNGDGKPDLVVSNAILLGNGDGTAQTQIGFDLGVNVVSSAFVTGDFNGDGKTDLAVGGSVAAQGNVPTTWILLGNGDGTFQPAVSYPLGAAVTSGDFNGDGIIDLVAANGSGNMGILLGNGDGTFRQGLNSSPGAPLAVADFNGDGRADILTANSIVFGVTGATFSITATGGTPQSASIGNPFALPLQVTVRNNGVPAAGATVTFTVPASGASAVLSSSTVVTNASGVASVTATANSVAGSYLVTAAYQGLTASFSLTNTTFAFITATGGTPQSTPTGVAFPTALQATVKDSIGNPVSGVTVAFAAPAAGASAMLSSATAVTNALGVASVTATANNTAGSYTVTANVGALSASFALTNTPVGSSNLAQGKSATQSSTFAGYATTGPASAVDGNTDGIFGDGSVTHTNLEANPWWQVDLGASATVNSIVIWNRTDCCAERLSDYWVFVSDTPFGPNDTPATLQNRPGTFGSHQATAPNPSATIMEGVQGRYVRVQLTGSNYLSLAEVLVMGTGAPAATNLAQGKSAAQSSTFAGYATTGPASAVDGSTDGNFLNGSVTHTNLETNPWWQVDLGTSSLINSVEIWNRTDCCADRLNDYWVFVSDTPFAPTDTPATLQNRPGTFSSHRTIAPNPSITISGAGCSPPASICDTLGGPHPNGAQGRYVRVQLSGVNYLSLAEVRVIGVRAPVGSNLALTKPATQSSTLPLTSAAASSAVDGVTDGNFFNGSVTHTNLESNAWWQVDLGTSVSIASMVIWNRTDCCSDRLSDFWVFVSDTPFSPTDTPATLQGRAGTFSSHQTNAPNPSSMITASMQGRYVRVQLTGAGYLSLAEVQVFSQ